MRLGRQLCFPGLAYVASERLVDWPVLSWISLYVLRQSAIFLKSSITIATKVHTTLLPLWCQLVSDSFSKLSQSPCWKPEICWAVTFQLSSHRPVNHYFFTALLYIWSIDDVACIYIINFSIRIYIALTVCAGLHNIKMGSTIPILLNTEGILGPWIRESSNKSCPV